MRWLALAALLTGCARAPLEALPADVRPHPTADRGPHSWAQTEWWHVHAALADVSTGEPLHVFAVFVVQRPRLDRVAGLPARWGPRQVHLALVQLQDSERTWQADRTSLPDLWTARTARHGLDLRHGDWRIAWEGDALLLEAGAGPHRVDLRLIPTGEPVLPGEGGRVELQPGAAHLWIQHEAMAARARVETGSGVRWLEGSGLAKHQWGRLYDEDLDGFEWLSMDLDEEHSLVVAWLHEDGMRGVEGSLAWLSDRTGALRPLEVHRMTPLRTWTSRRSGAEWPVAWHLEGPDLDLVVETELEDQELWGPPAAVHVGPATARGQVLGLPVQGPAFVEQVGHHMPRVRALYRSEAP